MSAPQDESRCAPATSSMARVRGSSALVLVVTALLTAPLGGSVGTQTRVIPAPAKMRSLPELKAPFEGLGNELDLQPGAISYDEARKLNAAIPISEAVGAPAPPFQFTGSAVDKVRAADCLAIAAMAEAGTGDDDQRAVIQVVLNRVRHSAFAKTICGVIFQGARRSTGCQFSFTCDGALARRHSAAAWTRARERATQALDGRVFAPIGLATHYHTDWVHPSWSESLTKLARVHTHLFFRWPGYWGSAASFSAPYRGGEPAIAQLADPGARTGATEAPAAQALGSQATSGMAPRDVVVRNEDGGAFVLLVGAPSAASAREMGRQICMDQPSCKVFGWFDRAAIPSGYPVPPGARAQLAFSYFRGARHDEIVLYDCARFSGVADEGCMPSMGGSAGPPRAGPALTLASR